MKLKTKFLPSIVFVVSNLFLSFSFDYKPSNAQATGVFLSNLLTGKCIDVGGAPGRENGTPLILWDCELSGDNADNGSPTDQRWILRNDGFIVNELSGKCLDVAGYTGRSNSSKLIIYNCEFDDPRTDQRWTFTSNKFIRNLLTGKCIDVVGAPGRENGAQLQLWDCELSGRNADYGSPTDQKWTVQY